MVFEKRSSKQRSTFTSKKAFGDAVSTLIMFIAVITITTGLVIAFQNYVSDTQGSLKVQNEVAVNKLKTIVSVTNVYYNSTSQDLYIYVKNIGETKLRAQNFEIFVDDAYYNDFAAVIATNLSSNSTLFQPQQTIAMIRQIVLNSGSHDVKVVTEFGVGDSDSFNI